MNTRNSQRRRFVSVPNDMNSGGLGQTKHAAPTIQVEQSVVSPASSRRGSENIEFMSGTAKEASLATLNVGLNLRRRRRMSANTEQIQASQPVVEEEPTTYFHKVFKNCS